jgi:hypothetical protein
LEKLTDWKHFADFLVIEELGSIFEQLELAPSSRFHLYFNTFFCSFFAQAPGRASQIDSEEAAFYFNHVQFLQTSFAARIVFT